MRRRFEIFGLVAVVVTALAAAGGASASAADFHSGASTTYFQGIQSTQTVFTFSGVAVKCTAGEFATNEPEGANPLSSSTASEVTVHPTYSSCVTTTMSSLPATITTTGCNYTLGVTGATTGTAKVVCSGSNAIVIKIPAAGCTGKIFGHTPSTPAVDYANQSSKTTVLTTWTVEGMSYSMSGVLCGSSGVNGKLSGAALFKGFTEAGFGTQTSIWVQ